MAGLLLLPSTSRSSKLAADIEEPSVCLRSYSLYLDAHADRQHKVQTSPEPLRDPSVGSLAQVIVRSKLTEPYADLQARLDAVSLYEAVFVNEYAPADRYLRRTYIRKVSLDVDVFMNRMAYGNSVGTLTFVWKIDQSLSDHQEQNAHVLLKVTEKLPKYRTRDMKKTFLQRYTHVSNCPTMVMRNISKELTKDTSAACSAMEAGINDRVFKFLLSSDDTDLILDMRTLNSRPNSTKFNTFWDLVRSFFFLEEHLAAVSERRHGADYLYLPFAISVEDLLHQVKVLLPPDAPISSIEWLRLQFWPTDPYTSRAMCYSGRFDIKFRVQSRLIRADHQTANMLLYSSST